MGLISRHITIELKRSRQGEVDGAGIFCELFYCIST